MSARLMQLSPSPAGPDRCSGQDRRPGAGCSPWKTTAAPGRRPDRRLAGHTVVPAPGVAAAGGPGCVSRRDHMLGSPRIPPARAGQNARRRSAPGAPRACCWPRDGHAWWQLRSRAEAVVGGVRATRVRQPGARGPYDAGRPGWTDRHACASGAESRGSYADGDCWAGRCACSRFAPDVVVQWWSSRQGIARETMPGRRCPDLTTVRERSGGGQTRVSHGNSAPVDKCLPTLQRRCYGRRTYTWSPNADKLLSVILSPL